MRKYATASIILHLVLVVVGYVGLPSFTRDPGLSEVPVTVEILTVTSATNVPVMTKAPTLPPEPKPAAKPRPPQASKTPPPPPPPPPPELPEPSQTAMVVEPDTRPRPQAKEKPKSEDTPQRRKPTPVPKPEPPDPFASVLKTLDDLQSQPKAEKVDQPKEKEPPAPTFEQQIAEALETQTVRQDLGPSLTISEIDLVRQQIARCWALPAGAKDAHEMTVELRVMLNPDGVVQGATIENQSLMAEDPFYKAMAESALRAVLKCSPLKLPADKYEDWRDLQLSFNPKEMFGL